MPKHECLEQFKNNEILQRHFNWDTLYILAHIIRMSGAQLEFHSHTGCIKNLNLLKFKLFVGYCINLKALNASN